MDGGRERSYRLSELVQLASRFISVAGNYAVLPFLALILHERFRLDVAFASMAVAGMMVASRLAIIPATIALRRVPPGAFVLIVNFGNGLVLAALALLGPGHWWVALVLIVAKGCLNGGQGLAFKLMVAASARDGHEVAGFASLTIASNIGSVVGPAMSALVETGDGARPLFVAAALYFISGALMLRHSALFTMPLPSQDGSDNSDTATSPISVIPVSFFVLYALESAVVFQLVSSLALYLRYRGAEPWLAGYFLSVQSALSILALWYVGRRGAGAGMAGALRSFLAGVTLLLVGIGVFGALDLMSTYTALAALAVLLTAAEALSVPMADTFILKMSDKRLLSREMGRAIFFQSLGTAIGAALSGPLLEASSRLGSVRLYFLFWTGGGMIIAVPCILRLMFLLRSRMQRADSNREPLLSANSRP